MRELAGGVDQQCFVKVIVTAVCTKWLNETMWSSHKHDCQLLRQPNQRARIRQAREYCAHSEEPKTGLVFKLLGIIVDCPTKRFVCLGRLGRFGRELEGFR